MTMVATTFVLSHLIACSHDSIEPSNSEQNAIKPVIINKPSDKSVIKKLKTVEEISKDSKDYIADVLTLVAGCKFKGEGVIYDSFRCEHEYDLEADYKKSRTIFNFYLDKSKKLKVDRADLEDFQRGLYATQIETLHFASYDKNNTEVIKLNKKTYDDLIKFNPKVALQMKKHVLKYELIEVLKLIFSPQVSQINEGAALSNIELVDDELIFNDPAPKKFDISQSCDWLSYRSDVESEILSYALADVESVESVYRLPLKLMDYLKNVSAHCSVKNKGGSNE